MDGRGAWRDDVVVEWLWKSVKYERVYLHAYDAVIEARKSIIQFNIWTGTTDPATFKMRSKNTGSAYTVMLPTVDRQHKKAEIPLKNVKYCSNDRSHLLPLLPILGTDH